MSLTQDASLTSVDEEKAVVVSMSDIHLKKAITSQTVIRESGLTRRSKISNASVSHPPRSIPPTNGKL